MRLTLHIKPFSFRLIRNLCTSQGTLREKQGWLLRLLSPSGQIGWGEVSPTNIAEINACEKGLKSIKKNPSRIELEEGINILETTIGESL